MSHFDLQQLVAEIYKAPSFVREPGRIALGVAIPTGGIDLHTRARTRFGQHVRQMTMQRQVGDLRRRIPERHVERSDRHAALAVTTRLLAGHHHVPCAHRIEIASRRQQPRGKPFADEPTLGITPERSEAVPHDSGSVPAGIRDDRDDARRETAARRAGSAESRDRHRALPDFDDSHAGELRRCRLEDRRLRYYLLRAASSFLPSAPTPSSGQLCHPVWHRRRSRTSRPACSRRLRRVGDLRCALLGHPLVLQRLCTASRSSRWHACGHRATSVRNGRRGCLLDGRGRNTSRARRGCLGPRARG